MGLSRKSALGCRKRKRRLAWQHALPPAAKVAAPAAAAKRVLGSSRRPSWKLIGLAGIAGVAATGVVVARQRRARADISPDELRERLHDRLAAVGGEGGAAAEPGAAESEAGDQQT